MRVRRFLCLLLGAWLGASFLMIFSATQAFRVAGSSLASPPPQLAGYVEKLGPEPMRQVLRYQASEQNRHLFDTWGLSQFFVALSVFLVILFATSSGKFPIFLSLGIVILTGIMQWVVSPQINASSRVLDFVPLTQMETERARMMSIHGIYSTMQVIALLLVGLLAGLFLFTDKRRSRSELR